jgi:hypothetical protein
MAEPFWRGSSGAGLSPDFASAADQVFRFCGSNSVLVLLHRVDDEVGERIGRHPVAQIRWEQQRGVVIDVY